MAEADDDDGSSDDREHEYMLAMARVAANAISTIASMSKLHKHVNRGLRRYLGHIAKRLHKEVSDAHEKLCAHD